MQVLYQLSYGPIDAPAEPALEELTSWPAAPRPQTWRHTATSRPWMLT